MHAQDAILGKLPITFRIDVHDDYDSDCYFLSIGVQVNFEELIYSASEGQEIAFAVVLSAAAGITVTVEFATRDDTAAGKLSLFCTMYF